MEYPYDSITFKQIHELLGKYVKVKLFTSHRTTKTEILDGYLYTIDPITKTLVLLKKKEISNVNQNQIKEKEQEKEKRNAEPIDKYQIIVIMESIIQNLLVIKSLINYLNKNKIDYVTQPDQLPIKIYNNKVEILPPYTQSCIKSDDYGSKDIAINHIKRWWDEK
ncbi:hypothetical protein BCR36DRAFT_584567 [Piromyces finnis]|uniref:AD domain-containing protein n=1 Tax=Piromyces finnis TaxID=1754191 RepID=A0A1Y1V5N4_9FUNG|nr:hypothetical protein BCR36DRAFT_584567 [Piromyces finnis]|eukprot:ORX47861.1 hypothetical protein BCR36DRAFT_584567 [Piromyces finnis]